MCMYSDLFSVSSGAWFELALPPERDAINAWTDNQMTAVCFHFIAITTSDSLALGLSPSIALLYL